MTHIHITESPFDHREEVRITDAQWDAVKDLFDCRRKRKHTIREIIDAILYVFDNDVNWRMLPKTYPPWQTVYYYFDKWRKTGVLHQVLTVLPDDIRVKIVKSSFSAPYSKVQVRALPAQDSYPEKAYIHNIEIRREAPRHEVRREKTYMNRNEYSWLLRSFLDEEEEPPTHNRAA